jgi:hypothetical protein
MSMSDMMVRETLMAIPPDDFLDIYSSLRHPASHTPEEESRYVSEAPSGYILGGDLYTAASKAWWDDDFSNALQYGSDWMFLSLLAWAKVSKNSRGFLDVRHWLATPDLGFKNYVKSEMQDAIKFGVHVDDEADRAQDPIRDYVAFTAVGASLIGDLVEQGQDVQIAEAERFGFTLAGLAIDRQLSDNPEFAAQTAGEIDALEALLSLDSHVEEN